MAKTLARIKVGSTIIKLVSVKAGFKVSYGSLHRTFSDIEKAKAAFDDNVRMFTENYSKNVVSDFNKEMNRI